LLCGNRFFQIIRFRCELPMRRLLRFIGFAAWILITGCSTSGQRLEITPEAATGILPGEQIVVLVSRYRLEGKLVEDLGAVEQRFEQCIRWGAWTVNGDLTFLPPAALRKLVPADTFAALTAYVTDDGTRSPESPLPLLGEPATAKRLAEERLRYVVLVVANYSTSASVKENVAAIPFPPMFAYAREWTQISDLQATILDLKHARIAGSVTSWLTGNEGAGGGAYFFLPFPVYYTSITESRACATLGKGLARFIAGSKAALPRSAPGGEEERWEAKLSCDSFANRPAFITYHEVLVTGKTFSVEHGERGKPGSFQLSGTAEPDGRLQLAGDGVAASDSRGSRTSYKGAFDGKFAGGRCEGTGQFGAQDCTLTMFRAQ
jgi:hypothetical protein